MEERTYPTLQLSPDQPIEEPVARMQESESPNPFASQPENPGTGSPPGMPPSAGGTGMFAVIPVLCVLMIVLGSMELLYALLVGGFLVLGATLEAGQPSQAEAILVKVVSVLIFGGVGFIGLLRIVAAVSGFKYRGWAVMMVACCFGLASVFTCYCAPFSLVVGILGIIVLSDSHVRRAFKLAEEGCPPGEIRQMIAGK